MVSPPFFGLGILAIFTVYFRLRHTGPWTYDFKAAVLYTSNFMEFRLYQKVKFVLGTLPKTWSVLGLEKGG